MKQTPILYSGPMVRAYIDDDKQHTRRVSGLGRINQNQDRYKFIGVGYPQIKGGRGPFSAFFEFEDHGVTFTESVKCPWGGPGDEMWLRETWRPFGFHEGESIIAQYRADMGTKDIFDADEEWETRMAEQAAAECEKGNCPVNEDGEFCPDEEHPLPVKWRPSIHMPRVVSRLTQTLLEVRVERLQDITEDDCKAEGVDTLVEGGIVECGRRKTVYRELWDHLNAKRGFPWDSNPYVWVLKYPKYSDEPTRKVKV